MSDSTPASGRLNRTSSNGRQCSRPRILVWAGVVLPMTLLAQAAAATDYEVWAYKLLNGKWEKQFGRTLKTTDYKKAKEYAESVDAVKGWKATSNLPSVPPSPAEQEKEDAAWIGRKIVSKDDVKFRAAADKSSKTEEVHLPTTVKEARGDWLLTGRGWILKQETMTLNEAAQHYTEQIAKGKGLCDPYRWRARIWHERGDFENEAADYLGASRVHAKCDDTLGNLARISSQDGDDEVAIKLYSQAIALEPNSDGNYTSRAMAWINLGEFDKAIRDCNIAMKINSSNSRNFRISARAHAGKGEYDKAIANYERAIQLDPDNSASHEARAWFLATCPDAAQRNARNAVEGATKACELSKWEDAEALHTLAAAWAEAGDFEAAVNWQTKAIDLASSETTKAKYRDRLNLFRAETPYRDELGATSKPRPIGDIARMIRRELTPFEIAKPKSADDLGDIKSPDEILKDLGIPKDTSADQPTPN